MFERWFQHFKSNDFNVAGKEHGKPPKKYELLKPWETIDTKHFIAAKWP